MDIEDMSNRIYDYTSGYPYLAARLCNNWFISDEYMDSKLYDAGLQGKSQFITGGHLNIRRILERFVESFDDLYGDQDETYRGTGNRAGR